MGFLGTGWIFITLLAAVMEAISSIFDRYLIKNEIRNTDTMVVIWGFFAGFMFCLPALLTGTVEFSLFTLGISATAALLYLAATHFYYGSVKNGEVSRVIPILSLNPVIVLILATILLGEVHTPIRYLGILLILIGVLIHAVDREHHRLINRKALYWALIAAALFAIKNILANYLTIAQVQPLNSLFWIGLGILIFNIPVTIKLWKKIKVKKKKHLPDLAMAAALAGSSTLIYTTAVIIGPVALVTFLSRISILFVFLISESMDFLRPQLLHEKFVKPAFWQKLIGVLIVLAGSYLLI